MNAGLMLGLIGLGVGGMMLLNKDAHAGIPPQGELTTFQGPSGTNYMVMLGEAGDTGRQLVTVYNVNEEIVLLYVQDVDGSNRSVVNSRPNPNLASQSDTALKDFGFRK